jgi:hypothetical protein
MRAAAAGAALDSAHRRGGAAALPALYIEYREGKHAFNMRER